MMNMRDGLELDRQSSSSLHKEERRYLILALSMTLVGLVLLGAYVFGVVNRINAPEGGDSAEMAPTEDAIVVVVARTAGGPRTWKSYAQAMAYVAKSTGLHIAVKYAMDAGEMQDLFLSGTADAAFACNSCFIDLQDEGEAVPLVSPLISGVGTDTAVVVVAASSDVQRFEDLQGGSAAVVKPSSLAGNAYLHMLLHERSLDAATFFSRVVVGSSQERNLEDVYKGRIDATAVNRSQLAGLPEGRYRIIVESEPFSLAPFVVSPRVSVDDREAIKAALLRFRSHVESTDGLVLEGFTPFTGMGQVFLRKLKASTVASPTSGTGGAAW